MVIGRDAVEWRVLVPLSFRYFGLACRLAIDAHNEGEKPDIAPPAGAVVLSVAALEAFVNEQADSMGHANPAASRKIETALRKRELPDRWEALVQATSSVGFRRGEGLFQAFDRLHELRNAIVHYRPHFLVPGALPDTKRGRVLGHLRHEYALRNGPDNAPWTYRYLSPGCGAWACRTGRDMIRAHFELVGASQQWNDRYAAMWPLPTELASAPRA